MSEKKKKEFIGFRIIKRIFLTGFINILPTLLVISILVIAYNFLETNLGRPINKLIKRQLRTNWKDFSINYLKIDATLFVDDGVETDRQIFNRLKASSISYNEAKLGLEHIEDKFNEAASPFMKKKALSNDQEYIQYLDEKIDDIKKESGYESAKRKFDIEVIALNNNFEQEKKLREVQEKLGDSKPQQLKKEIDRKYPDIIGIFVTLVLIFFLGLILTTVAGSSFKRFWTRTISSLPVIRKLYPYTKQLTEFLFAEKTVKDFKSVVLLEYPRKGIYSMGFPTGRLNDDGDNSYISVIIPSSPTPFTGYTIIVKENEVIPLNVSVEDAIKFTITGGVIKAPSIKKIKLG